MSCFVTLLSAAHPADAAHTRDSEARAMFNRGLELQRRGELVRACQAFTESVELAGTPHAWLQVGNCRESRDPVGALVSFEAALAAAGKVADPTRRRAYEDAARQRIEVVRARIPTLTFWPSPTPGARVEIVAEAGGMKQIVTSFGGPQRFNPGRYRVQAHAPGSETFVQEVRLRSGEHLEIDVPALAALPPLTASSRGFGGTPEPEPWLKDDRRLRAGVVPVVLVSTGAALLLTSVVTGRISSAARDELERECAPADALTGLRACDRTLASAKERATDYAVATDALWLSGVAVAGTGVAWFLLDGRAKPAPALRGGCAGGGCGVSVTGSF